MKRLASAVSALMFFALVVRGEEYHISLRSDGEEVAVVELTIEDDMAVAKSGDAIERFDLAQLRWQHETSGQWVSLSQCEKWAEESKERSSKSTAAVPAEVRRFALWSLDPAYDVESTDAELTLTSGRVDYRITGERSDRDLTRYFQYARLNAYKKAMLERKLLPFAELLAIDEMERSGLLPRSIEVRIPGAPGAPTIEMVMTDK